MGVIDVGQNTENVNKVETNGQNRSKLCRIVTSKGTETLVGDNNVNQTPVKTADVSNRTALLQSKLKD